jgi:hypothetical protein
VEWRWRRDATADSDDVSEGEGRGGGIAKGYRGDGGGAQRTQQWQHK